ncbi:unnamed protein product [Bursaphelenchus okinawaensis]|uniref:Uncharacterized protein n=1 Tax=Bursaphelenchus okinawaensis TaxID=465554 RepID=A0A811JXX9_9BILA|nr:unnamed protein product [Bursaphelenchus okinawaensis]CAG9086745.1 unnamed protein product [Bursaphelenchus okinawaensis]
MSVQIFTDPHVVECLEGKLFLERFIDKEPIEVSENLQQLTLSASVPNDFRSRSIKSYYQECVRNLISVAPNLKLVKILGGVQYAPKNPSTSELRNEFVFVKETVQSIISAFNNNNITLFGSSTLDVHLLIPKQLAHDTGFPDSAESLFGVANTKEKSVESLITTFDMDNGATFTVELSIVEVAFFSTESQHTPFYVPEDY